VNVWTGFSWISKGYNSRILGHSNKPSVSIRTGNVWVRFQILTAASMNMVAFWVVATCGLVDVCRRFRGACCLHHHHVDDGRSNHR
jgi:hypothetical protein